MCKFEKTPYDNFTKGNLNVFINKSEDEITWVTAERKVLKLSEISDSHLANLIDWLKDKNPKATYLNRVFGEWMIIFVDEHNKRILRKDAERAYNEEAHKLNQERRKYNVERIKFAELSREFEKAKNSIRSREQFISKRSKELEEFKQGWGF